MALIGCITLIFICFAIFIKIIFDKKYSNTQVSSFIRRCVWVSRYFVVLVWFIFVFDVSSVQDNSKHAGLGALIIILFSPLLVAVGFLVGLILFIALFMVTDLFLLRVNSHKGNYIFSILLTTLIMVIGFELIWWKWFYSEGSILMRVLGWNFIILVLPWIPIMVVCKKGLNPPK